MIWPPGEITDTGQRIATGAGLTVSLDFTFDGRWAISGGSVNAGIALFEIHGDGTVTLADSGDDSTGPAGTQGLRFARDLTSIVGLGLIDDSTVSWARGRSRCPRTCSRPAASSRRRASRWPSRSIWPICSSSRRVNEAMPDDKPILLFECIRTG
ncbi:MAG: hypothetical protein HUU25_05220 [Candidatus Sumerlaeia bacterium]|nr:hypothetical protein [Candidatus Sumerlaeia bacterium]